MAYNRRYLDFLIILAVASMVIVLVSFRELNSKYVKITRTKNLLLYNTAVDEFYDRRKSWNTSNLGTILFKNDYYPMTSAENTNKNYLILVWKRWKFLQNRHIYYFGSISHDPLEDCSVRNCNFTGNDSLLDTADAVLVHLHTALIPKTQNRNPKQKWIFLDDESPMHSFAMASKKPRLVELANVFNWSMTYRSDSDVPVPYGRTVSINAAFTKITDPISSIVPNWKIKRRDVLITILISNCVPFRMKMIQTLKKQLQVHVHGKCGDESLKNSCPGHFKADCKVMSEYLFYLVLENSMCKEYMTEKMFYHAYSKGAIPIIQGPKVEDCKRLLPPNSYLHIDNYANLEELAKDVLAISDDNEKLLSYHSWRVHFEVRNEHGYFGSKSYHLCRLCEAMNYNDMKTSVYDENDLRRFLDEKRLCRKK